MVAVNYFQFPWFDSCLTVCYFSLALAALRYLQPQVQVQVPGTVHGTIDREGVRACCSLTCTGTQQRTVICSSAPENS
jgi:hypothetical protein